MESSSLLRLGFGSIVITSLAIGPLLAQEETDQPATGVTGLYRLRHQKRVVPTREAAADPAPANLPTPAVEQRSSDSIPVQDSFEVALPPAVPPTVRYESGLLSITAENSNLSAVLAEVQKLTGAEIENEDSAPDERIYVQLGPAPAAAVMRSLLAGSVYDFAILNSRSDPEIVERVLLLRRKQRPPQATAPVPASARSAVTAPTPRSEFNAVEPTPKPRPSGPSEEMKAAREQIDQALKEIEQKVREQQPLQ